MMSEWAALLSPGADQGKDLDSQGNPRPLQDHPGGSYKGTVAPPGDTPRGRRKGRQGERGAEAPPHCLTELLTEGAQDGLPGTLPLCEEEPKDPRRMRTPAKGEGAQNHASPPKAKEGSYYSPASTPSLLERLYPVPL